MLPLRTASGEAITVSGFEAPESALVDPADGSVFVSNINGDPLVRDGNGYLSKIEPGGSVIIQKFIAPKDPLHAPKGLALIGDVLYVTDIDKVRGFNKTTGESVVTVDLEPHKAKFLNDLAADDHGTLYVSEFLNNRIFAIDTVNGHAPRVLVSGALLSSPNGLMVNPKTKNLMVVTWESGRLLEVDRAGRLHSLKKGLVTPDGVDYDNEGNVYVSSFERGEIYRISRWGRGRITTFQNGLVSPADIAVDRRKKELIVPSLKGNTLASVPLAQAA